VLRLLDRKTCELNCNEMSSCQPYLTKLFSVPDYESHTGIYDILYCTKGDIAFTSPYPSEDTSHYLYDTKSTYDFDIIRDSIVDTIKDYLAGKLVKRLYNKIDFDNKQRVLHFLDFGTGNGRFAYIASRVINNSIVHGVDFQKETPALYKSSKNKIRYYYIDDFINSKIKYDIIFLRHVLEHNHNPLSFLKKLSSHLTDEGLMYIEVPNFNSGCCRILKEKWQAHNVPRHIIHYTPESLKTTLDKCGFNYTINLNEMPKMGNQLALLMGAKEYNLFWQICGIMMHPLQLITEKFYGSATCINAICKLPHKQK